LLLIALVLLALIIVSDIADILSKSYNPSPLFFGEMLTPLVTVAVLLYKGRHG
jgi:hypothetical protein